MSWPYSLHRVLVGERKGWCFRLGFPLLKLSHSNSGKNIRSSGDVFYLLKDHIEG